jgi:orotate phosphoribosyltransferase
MRTYQQKFIELALAHKVLQFGEFTLKSGRISPYFFNAGLFYSGAALAEVGRCYAQAIIEAGIDFDLVFGPAYKGIPLAAATCIALADVHRRNVPYSYNRKEAKDHGEGGLVVGAALKGRAVIVDDVITAGTAIREVLQLFSRTDATPAAIVVGLDRQEKGPTGSSAIQELQANIGVPVLSIITLEDIMAHLKNNGEHALLLKAQQYREKYGV